MDKPYPQGGGMAEWEGHAHTALPVVKGGVFCKGRGMQNGGGGTHPNCDNGCRGRTQEAKGGEMVLEGCGLLASTKWCYGTVASLGGASIYRKKIDTQEVCPL